MINYHFVFCPRYRRKIFDIPGVEKRFKELTATVCRENGFRILAMECHHDHVHIFLNVLPQYSPSEVMKIVKGATSHELRDEFPKLSKMPNLWTRNFYCSTAGEIRPETICKYVETQKSR